MDENCVLLVPGSGVGGLSAAVVAARPDAACVDAFPANRPCMVSFFSSGPQLNVSRGMVELLAEVVADDNPARSGC